MDRPVYLFYLVSANRENATFAVFTNFEKGEEKRQWRVPVAVSFNKSNDAFYEFGRRAIQVETQAQFEEWINQTRGWAVLTEDRARQFVPHWLTSYDAARFRVNLGVIEWTEFSLVMNFDDPVPDFTITGADPEPGFSARFLQITDNLVLARRPIRPT